MKNEQCKISNAIWQFKMQNVKCKMKNAEVKS